GVLVAPRGELAEQAVAEAAPRVETDDVAQVGLGIEIAPQRHARPSADQEQWHALGLVIERVGAHRDHPRVVPGLEQLVGCRDDSTVHSPGDSKPRASLAPGQTIGITVFYPVSKR